MTFGSTTKRFVILEHNHPILHWDLMLESDGVLKTWRLMEEPAAGKHVATEPLADHRVEYLDYEGPVSGDRGEVKRWDAGTYFEEARSGRSLTVCLNGSRLSCRVCITSDTATFT